MSGESKGKLGNHKVDMYFGSDGLNNYCCGSVSYDNCEYENLTKEEIAELNINNGEVRDNVKNLLLNHTKEELAELIMQLADNGRESVDGENI